MRTECVGKMTAEDILKIMLKNRPKIVNYWLNEAELIWMSEHDIDYDFTDEDADNFENSELIFATAIIYDLGQDFAKKVGKILVEATK